MNRFGIAILLTSFSFVFAGDCSKAILRTRSGFSLGEGLNRYIFIFKMGPISISENGTTTLRVQRLRNSGGGYEDVENLSSEENRDILFHINFLKSRIRLSTHSVYKVVVKDGNVSVFGCSH